MTNKALLNMLTVRHGLVTIDGNETPVIVVRMTVEFPEGFDPSLGKNANVYSVFSSLTIDLANITDYASFIASKGYYVQSFDRVEDTTPFIPTINKLYPETTGMRLYSRYGFIVKLANYLAWWQTEGQKEWETQGLKPAVEIAL